MNEPADAEGQVHLSPEAIVRYIDHTTAAEDRRAVERHLADCEACLREVIESQRVLRGTERGTEQ